MLKRKIGNINISRYKEGDYTVEVKRSPDFKIISYKHRDPLLPELKFVNGSANIVFNNDVFSKDDIDGLVKHLKELKEISPSK
jgi:hypothetical protein